jgi:hypothetical protein
MSFKSDYEFGKKQELSILEIINEKFKDNIELVKYEYSTYDYKGDKRHYELKSRNNTYNKFPTTLIPASKIKDNKKIIFLFKFIDGLYYIKYRKNKFKDFKLDMFKRNQRIDYNDIKQLYYFIPIEKLKKI